MIPVDFASRGVPFQTGIDGQLSAAPRRLVIERAARHDRGRCATQGGCIPDPKRPTRPARRPASWSLSGSPGS